MPYECEHCGASFDSYYSLRSHVNGSVFEGIPRCARKIEHAIGDADAVITTPSDTVLDDADAVITTPVNIQRTPAATVHRQRQGAQFGTHMPPRSRTSTVLFARNGPSGNGANARRIGPGARWPHEACARLLLSLVTRSSRQ